MNRLSKYAHFIPLKHPFTTATVTETLMREVVLLHEFSVSIISDRDKIFLSILWRELFKLHETGPKRSTSYHPQTDDQSEIVNKLLKMYLRCFVMGQQKKWAYWLPWAELSYNTSPQTLTKFRPFQVLYGRELPRLMRVGHGQIVVDSLEEWLQERDEVLDELKLNLVGA